MSKFQKVAEFGVNSGQLIICDPKFLEKEDLKNLISIWCEKVSKEHKTKSIKFPDKHHGLAAIAETDGNGSLSVYERVLKTGVKQILIKFE